MNAEPSLKLLIVVRHGECESDSLSPYGKIQAQNMANAIASYIGEAQKAKILTSPLRRAVQTAEIISEKLKIEPLVCDPLRSDDFRDGKELSDLILKQAKKSDIVIAVTHYEAPSGIANHFSHKFGGKRCGCQETPRGDGILIDIVNKTIKIGVYQPVGAK